MLLSVNAGVSYLELDETESIANEEISDTNIGQIMVSCLIRITFRYLRLFCQVNNAGVVIASSITVEDFEEQGYQVLFRRC